MDIVVFLSVIAAVIFLGRRIPLPSRRRIGVIGLRLVGLCAVWLALRHYAVPSWREQPRHLVYLVDQSHSIDPEQTAWIARRLASLEAVRPTRLSRSLVVFGQQAHVVKLSAGPLTDEQALIRLLHAAPLDRDATNLESALLAGLGAIPPPSHGRATPPPGASAQGGLVGPSGRATGGGVILLSDGRQTAGNVERILPHARRFGLQVYPVVVPPTELTGLTWERLVVPTTVQQGSSIPVKLVVTNGTSGTHMEELTIRRDGLPLVERRVRIAPGWQIVSASVPASQAGTMRLEVSLAGEGPGASSRLAGMGSSSQQRTAYVEVEGPPRLLLIQEKPAGLPLLATALKRRAMDIALATPQELPTEAGQLLDYDAVLLFHTPKSAVSESQVAALRRYVEHFGGGVVMVGLGGKLDEEMSREAPLDALLPVRFEPKGLQEAKRRVCILLLIDRSASMLGPRIAATKRAAVELVRQLQPEDLVGVLAFDTTPYVVVEMQPAKQVSMTLIDKLVHLKSTGGTDFLPALQAARVRLEASGSTVKHAILLSDGNTPFDSNAYHQLLAGFARQQITLSTVAIGSTLVNTDLLAWLAKQGNGTFYQMRNLDELPQLIARDTQNALGQLPFAEGYVRPVRSPSSEWIEPNTSWPPLKGYLTTTAKPGSIVELTIPRAGESSTVSSRTGAESPLLAQWPIGLGHVAVFASDADTRWSSEWIRWPQFESVWAQIMRQAMRRRPSEEVFVWLDDQRDVPHLIIEGELEEPTAELVSDDGNAVIPLALIPHSRVRWHAPVGHIDSGWYRLMVTSHPPPSTDTPRPAPSTATGPAGHGSPAAFARRWVQIGHVERGPEQPHLPPDEATLRRIAQLTNGAMDEPDRAFLPATERVPHPMPLRGWLLPLALVLLLVDVALRGRTML